jgi:hypothetical protein
LAARRPWILNPGHRAIRPREARPSGYWALANQPCPSAQRLGPGHPATPVCRGYGALAIRPRPSAPGHWAVFRPWVLGPGHPATPVCLWILGPGHPAMPVRPWIRPGFWTINCPFQAVPTRLSLLSGHPATRGPSARSWTLGPGHQATPVRPGIQAPGQSTTPVCLITRPCHPAWPVGPDTGTWPSGHARPPRLSGPGHPATLLSPPG